MKAKHSVQQGAGFNKIYCGTASGAAAENYDNTPNPSGFICPSTSDCCIVQPSAKVKDNWGWCNNGEDIDPCPGGTAGLGFQLYGDWDTDGISDSWVIVTEK